MDHRMDLTHATPLPWSASDWSEATMGESIRLAAESLCAFGGFGAAAISVVREHHVVTVAVAGVDQVLAADGRPLPVSEILGRWSHVDVVEDRLLPVAETWGLLHYVPHDRSNMPELGWRIEAEYAGSEWHPHDMLLVPVRDEAGELRGLISLDAPTDGLIPPPERRPAIERYAAQAARILLIAIERAEFAERQRLAVAARRLLSRAAAVDAPERILADVSADLVAAFALAGLRASVFEDGERRSLVETMEGLSEDDEVVSRVVRRSTPRLWQQQDVGLVGREEELNFEGTAEELAHVRERIAARGLESIVLVPLGAGETPLGLMTLYRPAGAPHWTEAECEVAQEIGRDLGRLLSIRRALRREREAVEELRALDHYKTELIATVAHELKNPLAAIRGNLDLALSALNLAAPGSEGGGSVLRPALGAVDRGVVRIGRLVDDLLLLAAANDPNAPTPRETIDLRGYVSSGAQLALDPTGRPASDVALDLPDAPVLLEADPEGLERVVVNLVGNALKYTGDGPPVTVVLRDGPDRVELTVADRGLGISPEDQQRIFTEFFRSADPAARRQPGTGLGLAIVERIVARHHGRIEVDSEPGRGSTFRVVLPRR